MEFVDKITNNGFLRGIYYFPKKFAFEEQNKQFEAEAEKRRSGLTDAKYEKLMGLKGVHSNERCFIVATGPSLTISDLEMLNGEITFGMNSICKLFSETEWRPTYYGIQDRFVYSKMKSDIDKYYHGAKNVFVASTLQSGEFIEFPFNDVYNRYDAERRQFRVKFSDDAYVCVYNGFTITYSLIQLAVYMGFGEIYLLGTDCSYNRGQKNHVIESGHVDKYDYLLNYKRMVVSYEEAKKYADSKGIKIVNCTRGGMLEVYPRMSLEDVLL